MKLSLFMLFQMATYENIVRMRKEPKISKDMMILDILSDYPQTEVVFRSYDEQAGECICCQRLFDTLAVVIEEYQINEEELLSKLNMAAQS